MAIKRRKSDDSWVSFSDIMTSLMVIFMFIAISYMLEIQKKQKERDNIFEEFKATKDELFSELKKEFKDDFKEWDVVLDKDLSIKFANPEVLFESGKIEIRDYFEKILNDFLPRYFEILLKDKYRDKISEIRIEGHTDTVPARQYDKDPYIGNIILSQLRSTEVLKFFRNTDFYKKLSDIDEKRLQFLLTANGLSYGRTLDKNRELTAITKELVDNKNSRRVEFKIVTTSEDLVERVLRELGE
jgi:outer membrane protein OmpA-like peptidoglycan-associated protein